MKELIQHGNQSNIVRVWLADSSSSTGAGLTSLAYNTSGLKVNVIDGNGASGGTVLTLEDVTTVGTYQAPTSAAYVRFKEVDAADLPGMYELHFHDDLLASGDQTRLQGMVFGATDLAPTPFEIQLSGKSGSLMGFDDFVLLETTILSATGDADLHISVPQEDPWITDHEATGMMGVMLDGPWKDIPFAVGIYSYSAVPAGQAVIRPIPGATGANDPQIGNKVRLYRFPTASAIVGGTHTTVSRQSDAPASLSAISNFSDDYDGTGFARPNSSIGAVNIVRQTLGIPGYHTGSQTRHAVPKHLFVGDTATGASDSNPGTPDSPLATIGEAISNAIDGSIIELLPRGDDNASVTIWDEEIAIPNGLVGLTIVGSGLRTVVRGLGDNPVVVVGSKAHCTTLANFSISSAVAQQHGVQLSNSGGDGPDDVSLSDLYFAGTKAYFANCINATGGCENLKIRACKFRVGATGTPSDATKGNAISIGDSANGRFEDNFFSLCEGAGIYIADGSAHSNGLEIAINRFVACDSAIRAGNLTTGNGRVFVFGNRYSGLTTGFWKSAPPASYADVDNQS